MNRYEINKDDTWVLVVLSFVPVLEIRPLENSVDAQRLGLLRKAFKVEDYGVVDLLNLVYVFQQLSIQTTTTHCSPYMAQAG